MNQPLHVLILEDSPDDAELIVLALEDGGYTPAWERVDSAQAMRLALDRQAWDIIIADHSMPHFSVPKALELLKERGNHIPLIMVSGAVGDETAARIMRAGARDFIAKSNLARLVPSLRREMNEVRAEREHRRIQAELESLRHRNELILRAIGEGVCGLDEHGRIAFINPAAAAMLGYKMNELLGQLLSNFLHLPRPSVGRGIGPLLGLRTRDEQTRDVQTTLCEGLLCRKDGSVSTIEYTTTLMPERHEVISAVLVFRDISERKQNEARIQYLAHHDALTGLANRLLLNEQMQQAISSAMRHQRIGAVLLLDIDGFKNINDTQGHEAGDTLLKKIAQRLQICLRDEDTLARLGGDEFIIVLSEVAQAETVSGIAQKVLDCFKQPFDLEQRQVSLATSLGISLYPADAIYPDQLLRNADIAMYRAKRQGGNAYRFYTEQMNTEAIQRAALEISLRGGFLERHELLLHYQLQRDLRNGQIIGVEALLRWQHPEWGLLAPDRFIEAAERIGIIAHIDEWVLLQSCIQCKKWQDGWPHDLPVSVNCSAALLKQPNLLDYLKQVLTKTGLLASCLILEFTERVVIEDAPATIILLQEIRALGIRLSIDDFGIGYSSLNYLKLLPVDQLKIDQSFVSDLGNANTAAITRAVINLGHNLHLEVIAEGVETEWQLAALHDMGCDGGQGYYFDLPQSAEGFSGLLQQHKSLGEIVSRS